MDRRSFLKRGLMGAAALAAAGPLEHASRAFGAAPPPPAPPGSLVGALDTSRLLSTDELWDWQNFMVDVGPRFTGSTAHLRYLDFIEDTARAYGLSTFHDPTQIFPRWEADYTECSLSLLESGGSFTDLEVMSFFPYSGTTSRMSGGALTAPVVDAGQGLPQDFAAGIATGAFTGAIAFVTEPPLPVTDALGYPNYYNDDPDMTMNPATPFNKWSLSILSPQSLATPALAMQAGCSGMIIALQASADCARGQYLSFLATLNGDQLNGAPGLPTLYVDYKTGEMIKSRLSALGSTTSARMVLPADLFPNSGTDEIVAVLPGANYGTPDDEVVIVASHTDGTSASEENGPLGMLAIARYFSQLPPKSLRRTLVFCFATGHFTGYTKDTAWFVSHHPEILARTAATLTIEHLGQKSFTDDPARDRQTYDGYPEVGISYITQDPLLISSVVQNYRYEDLRRAPVINGPGFGVGTSFFTANLPSYAYITGPNSLYQMDKRLGMEGTDRARLAQEVRTFIRILQSWEGLSRDQLRAGKSLAAQTATGAPGAVPTP